MTTTTTSKAFARAEEEGLSYFRAVMHVGHSLRFVGHSWEDGGFSVDGEGNPRRDAKGNTVARFTTETLDPTDADHLSQCEEWFNG